MRTPQEVVRGLIAPERLGSEHPGRDPQGGQASSSTRCPKGAGGWSSTSRTPATIDSAGLGALMLIQRHAAERRQAVVLRAPSEEIRFLLVLTKLADLFEIDDAPERALRAPVPARSGMDASSGNRLVYPLAPFSMTVRPAPVRGVQGMSQPNGAGGCSSWRTSRRYG